MGRKWQPKYPVVCPVCGWTGKRTGRMMAKRCPRCNHYPIKRDEGKKQA